MRETKHTGGLMEFHYPKDYKTERTEVDEMRSKSIREYYEKEAIKKEKNRKVIVRSIFVVVILFLLLKILKII